MSFFLFLLGFFYSFLYGEENLSTYFIAIKKNEGDVLNTLDIYTPFLPPIGRFYADPFLFEYKGKNYLFFEDCDYKKGVISYVTLDQEGSISKPGLALELPIHLSFPYIFQDKEGIYMVPETYRVKAIFLYRCIEFPQNWERQRVLIRGHYFSDPILFQHDGYYWLFTAIYGDQLCIYYAKDLESQFLPHPVNFRKIKGRNAGGIFLSNGRLIRPTMDCRIKYGRAMIFKEILLLTPENFVEKEVGLIEPTWEVDLVGTHTYNQSKDFIVYDGERILK